MLLFIIVVSVVVALYLFMIMPSTDKKEQLQTFLGWNYAHRGLHDNNNKVPENSLKAFELAVKNGYGMELDVQLTADGKVVVFHDEDTKRLCGVDKNVRELSYQELVSLRLAETEGKIPLFSEMLELVDGKTPLIVELKPYNDTVALCEAVDSLLKEYKGLYCIESFSPYIVRWYKKFRPGVVRGQLSCRFKKGLQFFPLEVLLTNLLTRPDFIAYNHGEGNLPSVVLCRKLFGATTVAWTLRSQNELDNAKRYFDLFIFENFRPR